MTREEWYASNEFKALRLLHNHAHSIGHVVQELYDILSLVLQQNPQLQISDKTSLVERQMRVVELEADRLRDRINDLERLAQNHYDVKETDVKNY